MDNGACRLVEKNGNYLKQDWKFRLPEYILWEEKSVRRPLRSIRFGLCLMQP